MNPQYLILGVTIAGNAGTFLALLTIAWKGGSMIGRLEQSNATLVEDGRRSRDAWMAHAQLITRAIQRLDDIERRVGHLEAA